MGEFTVFKCNGKIIKPKPPLAYTVVQDRYGYWARCDDERLRSKRFGSVYEEHGLAETDAVRKLRQSIAKTLFGWHGSHEIGSEAIPGAMIALDTASRKTASDELFAATHIHLWDSKSWEGVHYEQVVTNAGILDLVCADGPWGIQGFEIKSCRADFLADKKWEKYLDYCHRLSFVTTEGAIKPDELPNGIGLYYLNPLWVPKGEQACHRRSSMQTRALIRVRLEVERVVGVQQMLEMSYALIRKGSSCTTYKACAAKVNTIARGLTGQCGQV